MTSPSRALKKELTQAFPGTTFTVKTHNSTVIVSWQLELGSHVTVNAVKAIAAKHQTVVAYGDLIDDSRHYTGYSIDVCPVISEERKQWAIDCILRRFAGITYNQETKQFEDENGKWAYFTATEYREYLQNGIASNLVDENGQEPSAKRWYYTNLEKEQEESKTEEVEEVETEEAEVEQTEVQGIQPVSIQPVTNTIYISAKCPHLNKNHLIEDYLVQLKSEDDFSVVSTTITKIVQLTPEDYETFTHSFLDDQEWLEGEGGTGSHYETKHENIRDFLNDREEVKKFRRQSYVLTVLVTDGDRYILVDPQRYGYARYVLFADIELENLLNQLGVSLPGKTQETAPIEIALEINQDKVVFKSSKPEGDRDLPNRVNKYLQFVAMQSPGMEVKVKSTVFYSNGTSSEETINLSPIDFFKSA